MARPTIIEIVSGQQGWDVDVTDNLRAAFKVSLPVANGTIELQNGTIEGTAYTSFGSLPSAAANDGCLAVVNASGVWQLYLSVGASWKRIGVQAVDPGNSTATNTAELVADFNGLLAALRTAGLLG